MIKMITDNNNTQTIGTREDREKAIAEKNGQIKNVRENPTRIPLTK